MNTYEVYINKALSENYTCVKNFRDTDTTRIDLYRHNNSGKKLIRIISSHRNDDIFRALKGKRNKYLPEIYDVCSCDDCVLILESFIEGKTLSDVMKESKISKGTAIKYVLDICEALNYIHNKKIIHRDVKPSNVIITPENNAVLIDLQVARTISSTSSNDTKNLGTVGYAAPEQFGIAQSLPPTDIYSLGVLLNELLVNAHPSVTTPSGKLGKIVKKCTDTQISRRYQSVEDLKSDLKRYQRFHI